MVVMGDAEGMYLPVACMRESPHEDHLNSWDLSFSNP